MIVISSNYFYCAAIITDGRITECAPIIAKHLLGLTVAQAYQYINFRRWKIVRRYRSPL